MVLLGSHLRCERVEQLGAPNAGYRMPTLLNLIHGLVKIVYAKPAPEIIGGERIVMRFRVLLMLCDRTSS